MIYSLHPSHSHIGLHQVDLALGHVAALQNLHKAKGCVVYNLGTGNGFSVLQIIEV